MKQRKVYRVLVTRFHDWWYLEMPELDSLAECRSLTEVERVSIETVSRALGSEMNSFGIAIELQPTWDEMLGEQA